MIGYWYDRPSAARAAVKAFWITKLGDLGFVAGIVMLWSATGTFDFWTLFPMGTMGTLPVELLPCIMFLIYLGAVGKSAQFPLHIWLPDAMEGPTPVSALIHAATMVTAGVFLVTRAFPLFRLTPDVLALIAWVGAFTALLAASMACVEGDIKRVLAYSTVSQLGYMMAAAGAAAPEAGFLHLVAHGVFKALLFLGRRRGDPRVPHQRRVPHGRPARRGRGRGCRSWWPRWPWPACWPLPGFFTKEAILAGVLHAHLTLPFLMLALTALLTAFYMFRVVFLAFFGPAPRPRPHAARAVADGLRVPAAGRAHAGDRVPHGVLRRAPRGAGLAARVLARRWPAPASCWPGRCTSARVVDPARVAAALWPIDALARRRYFLDAIFAGLYRWVLLAFARLIGWIGSLPGGRRAQRAERVDAAGGRPGSRRCRPGCPRTTSTAWRSACCCSSCWRSGA